MTNSEGWRWIEAAESDLSAAESLLESNHFHVAAFQAQQAAEKGLKGLLRLLGHIAWGHNCLDLLTQIDALVSDQTVPSAVVDAAQRLDGHYIPARYPDVFPTGTPADHYNKADAEQAVGDARQTLTFVRRLS